MSLITLKKEGWSWVTKYPSIAKSSLLLLVILDQLNIRRDLARFKHILHLSKIAEGNSICLRSESHITLLFIAKKWRYLRMTFDQCICNQHGFTSSYNSSKSSESLGWNPLTVLQKENWCQISRDIYTIQIPLKLYTYTLLLWHLTNLFICHCFLYISVAISHKYMFL